MGEIRFVWIQRAKDMKRMENGAKKKKKTWKKKKKHFSWEPFQRKEVRVKRCLATMTNKARAINAGSERNTRKV